MKNPPASARAPRLLSQARRFDPLLLAIIEAGLTKSPVQDESRAEQGLLRILGSTPWSSGDHVERLLALMDGRHSALVIARNLALLARWAHRVKEDALSYKAALHCCILLESDEAVRALGKQHRQRTGLRLRHLPKIATEVYAWCLYRSGSWETVSAFAKEKANDIRAFGKTKGFNMAPTNAERTIREWIYEGQKAKR